MSTTKQIKKLYVNGKITAIGDYTIEEKVEPAKYTIKCFYDDDSIYPHENIDCCGVKWYSNHRDYIFEGDISDLAIHSEDEEDKTLDDYNNIDDFVDALNNNQKEYKYFIISAYIHSGVSLYKGHYTGPDARWDSGVFAIAEVDNKDGKADERFNDDFEAMKAYAEGEVWCVEVLDELDNCCDYYTNFYGEIDEDVIDSIYDSIESRYNITKEDVRKAFDERFNN